MQTQSSFLRLSQQWSLKTPFPWAKEFFQVELPRVFTWLWSNSPKRCLDAAVGALELKMQSSTGTKPQATTSAVINHTDLHYEREARNGQQVYKENNSDNVSMFFSFLHWHILFLPQHTLFTLLLSYLLLYWPKLQTVVWLFSTLLIFVLHSS